MVTTLHGGVRTGGGESSRLESSSVLLHTVTSPFPGANGVF
jgi:hypothetical protein